MKEDEFADLYAEELQAAGEEKISGENFVDECQVESDLELLFPNEYIPSSSERMLLYRELDGLELDKDLLAFKARLEDRFGKVPPEGLELLRIVPLRRLAKRLGVEKVFLKAGRMTLFFISNQESPYYQSAAFGKVIDYLEKGKSRWLFMGLIVTLSFMFVSFEWTERNVTYAISDLVSDPDFFEELVPVTYNQDKPLPPPPPPAAVNPEELNIVDNNSTETETDIAASDPTDAPVIIPTPIEVPEEVVDENVEFVVVEEMPVFRNGNADLMRYLSENIKYPTILLYLLPLWVL